MAEQNGGFFVWLQDNARIILSIALVLFLLFAVYNYSQDRTDKVSKNDSKPKTEQKQDDKKSEDASKEEKETDKSLDKEKDAKKEDDSKNVKVAKKDDSKKKAEDANKISLSESADTIGAKTEKPKEEKAKDSKEEVKEEKEITGKGPNVMYNDDNIAVSAMRGDGLTHLARRATAEYLSHNNITDLDAGQKIYVEDYVRRSIARKRVKPGMTFTFKLSAFQAGVEKAKVLSDNQKKHLSLYAKKAGL